MNQLSFTVISHDGQRPLRFDVERLWNGGWASRDSEETNRHIAELEKMGIAPPLTTPILFPLSSNLAMTTGHIQVLTEETSGEVEFALVFGVDGIYVTVASDHTDRAFERHGVQPSKQLYPNVLAPEVWPYEECAGHWDRLALRCWVTDRNGTRLYQDAALADLISVDDWLGLLVGASVPQSGLILLSGTPPTKEGLVFGDAYDIEIYDPVLERRIRHRYTVEVLGPGQQ